MEKISAKHQDRKSEINRQNGNRSGGRNTERWNLKQYRVIQRDLVYVVGLPSEIAQESILSSYEYFGQYGVIKKISVNSQTNHIQGFQRPTVSAFVTFANYKDALECIYSLENFSLNGHQIKASLGTSKYCSNFLNNQKCTMHDCMYLHHIGNKDDTFSQEEVQLNAPRFVQTTRPSRPDDYHKSEFQNDKPTIFPPRRIIIHDEYTAQEDSVCTEEIYEQEFEIRNMINENHSEFIKSLFSPNINNINYRPLVPFYTTKKSLLELYNLNKPCVRSYLDR